MGFVMEFAENLILRLMEDPNTRDRKARQMLYDRFEKCKRTKEMHSLPMQPYGFWTFEHHNAQIFWDAQISQIKGRRDPYDDLLENYSLRPTTLSTLSFLVRPTTLCTPIFGHLFSTYNLTTHTYYPPYTLTTPHKATFLNLRAEKLAQSVVGRREYNAASN